MADLKVDEDLDVFIDNSGDIAFATGRAAFEQDIAIALVDFYEDRVIGEKDPDTSLELVRVGARRAVDSVGLLERLAAVDARFSEDSTNTILVDIIFDTGEQLSFASDGDTTPILTGVQVYDDGVYESSSSFDIYEDGQLQ